MTVSIEPAISSRDWSEKLIPPVPIEIPRRSTAEVPAAEKASITGGASHRPGMSSL